MQLFRTEEKLAADAAPRYDNETVRQVLARASEIEAHAETELLTATQVEVLGGELGLSPEAVRRALGEKVGRAVSLTSSATAMRRHILVPLTQEQVKAAYLSTLWHALLCFPTIFVIASAMRGGTTPTEVGAPIAVIVALVVPVLLACRSGFWRNG